MSAIGRQGNLDFTTDTAKSRLSDDNGSDYIDIELVAVSVIKNSDAVVLSDRETGGLFVTPRKKPLSLALPPLVHLPLRPPHSIGVLLALSLLLMEDTSALFVPMFSVSPSPSTSETVWNFRRSHTSGSVTPQELSLELMGTYVPPTRLACCSC
jgi:hypothetical protein